MALKTYSSTWKNCATCDNWAGKRQANEAKDSVIVDGSAVGICEGFWKGCRKYPIDKCTEWKKWPELTAVHEHEQYP